MPRIICPLRLLLGKLDLTLTSHLLLLLFCPGKSLARAHPVISSYCRRGSSFPRHVSSSPSTSHGLCHKFATSSVVGICMQLNKCSVLCSFVPHRGQSGEVCFVGFILCFQARSNGDFPARSCANETLVLLCSVFSDLSISGALVFKILLSGVS